MRVIWAFGQTIIAVLPVAAVGFIVPMIFKSDLSKHMAGQLAGGLFIASSVWCIFLADKHNYSFLVKMYFWFSFFATAGFWGWRHFQTRPLAEIKIFSYTGAQLHTVMTFLYIGSVVILMFSEYSARRDNRTAI